VGLDAVADLARDVGLAADPRTPSTALGVSVVSPLDLAAAYSAFVTGGAVVKPRLVTRIEDEDGRLLWASQAERRHVMQPSTAFLITDVLADAVVRGTGTPAQPTRPVPVAGKTGTTNDVKDAWFAGYTAEIVGAVWIGFDGPQTIVADATATQLAAPVWSRLVDRIYADRSAGTWNVPPTVLQRPIDAATGFAVSADCAGDTISPRREWFVAGTEPREVTCGSAKQTSHF
jgi:penicillin-binding protein 1A